MCIKSTDLLGSTNHKSTRICRQKCANNAFCNESPGQSCCRVGLRIGHNFQGTCTQLATLRISSTLLSFSQNLIVSYDFSSTEQPELSPLSFGGDILNEGDFAQVSCIVRKGDQPLAISWSFHGSNITSELGIVITPLGVRGSSLMIPSVEHKHRGTYTCKASNAAGVQTKRVELNVNGALVKAEGGHWSLHFNLYPN